MTEQWKHRWNIYLNGTYGVKEISVAMLTMWRYLLPACGLFGEVTVKFLAASYSVAVIFVMPFLFWLAPLISIFTAHRTLTDEEVRERLRRDIHRKGSSL
jgi:hypothetical protein